MSFELSNNLKTLANSCPFTLYIVGGWVRDNLAGFSEGVSDIDICAPVSAEEFISVAESCGFKVCAQYKNTGAVKVEADGENWEFTCFRTDEYVRGEHVPANVTFTTDINADARRRDFKCNAVYYDIKAEKIVDPLGGVSDIENRKLSTVAPASKVFGEDGLRLMRLARLAAETGFTPTSEAIEGAYENRELIRDVSPERIAAEIKAILIADGRHNLTGGHYYGFKILQKTGVLKLVLPELAAGDGLVQNKEFHRYDVLEHSFRTFLYAPKEIRLAALLHDIGKPENVKNKTSFARHEETGAVLAEEICKRLFVPKAETEKVVRLVATHMYDFRLDAKENRVRKFIVENYDIFPEILQLRQADYSACKDSLLKAPAVEKFTRIYQKMQKEMAPFTLKELRIKGNELIDLGFPPAEVGGALKNLLLASAMGLVLNNGQKLREYALKVVLPPLLNNSK